MQLNSQMLNEKSLGGGDEAFTTFNKTSIVKHIFHCMFLDLEPIVVDQMRIGTYRQLFHLEEVICD